MGVGSGRWTMDEANLHPSSNVYRPSAASTLLALLRKEKIMNRQVYISSVLALVVVLSTAGARANPSWADMVSDTAGNQSAHFSTTLASGQAREPMTAVGSGFAYQGRLLDGGSPATGTYDLRFTLFDAATGGN